MKMSPGACAESLWLEEVCVRQVNQMTSPVQEEKLVTYSFTGAGQEMNKCRQDRGNGEIL